jgi:hypothetical protein
LARVVLFFPPRPLVHCTDSGFLGNIFTLVYEGGDAVVETGHPAMSGPRVAVVTLACGSQGPFNLSYFYDPGYNPNVIRHILEVYTSSPYYCELRF